MWMFLCFLLLCAIGGILWWRSRQDEAWLREMSLLRQPYGQLDLLAEEQSQPQNEPAVAKNLYDSVYDNVAERLRGLMEQFQIKPADPEETARAQAAAEASEAGAHSGVDDGRFEYVDDDVPYTEHEPEPAETVFDLQTEDETLKEAGLQDDGADMPFYGAFERPSENGKAARPAARRPEPYIAPYIDDSEPEYVSARVSGSQLPVITLEEATRALHESLNGGDGGRSPDAKGVPLQTIEADDPVLLRTRARLLENVSRLEQEAAAKKEEPAPPSFPEPANREINEADIRANLLRQRTARHRQASAQAPRQGFGRPQVIEGAEVLANLAGTSAPVVRRQPFLNRIDTTKQESVIPETARVEQGAAKVKPKPLFPPKVTPRQQQGAFIAKPAAPTATVVEPPAVPEVEVRPVDIAKPPVFRSSPAVAAETASVFHAPPAAESVPQPSSAPAASVYVNSNLHWSIADRLISESAEEEAPVPSEIQTAPTEAAADGAVRQGALPAFQDEAHLPAVSLLLPPEFNPAAAQSEEALLENGIVIEDKLAEFKVKVKVVDAYSGPVITRYEIEPDVGVRGNAVLNLEKDLARSLGVASIRVVETIPGKTCMGLELPNPRRQMIRLSEIFNAPAFRESKSKLTLALGHDITGKPVVTDLARAPHLLVAGTTGSGKSVGVNAMILSMLFKATPDDVRMIMIDPKMLELSIYEGIPHLLAPVVTDMKLAANALNWCVNEMEKRYRLMSHFGVRNLEGFNARILDAAARGEKTANPFSLTPDDPEPLEKLPFIVVVVDEFADLMMTAGKKIEELIARLAQKARAAGIHLILATQRPSVDVITGLIKANIPTRIAFQVSSKIDSRTILDQMGAENLLGQGDMLFLPPGSGYPQRIHGAFASDSEVHAVVEYLKQFGAPDYIDDLLATGGSDEAAGYGRSGDEELDEMFDEAVAVVVKTRKASISGVQRHLRIGYNRAARLIDQMEAQGIVSAAESNGNRTVLIQGGAHDD